MLSISTVSSITILSKFKQRARAQKKSFNNDFFPETCLIFTVRHTIRYLHEPSLLDKLEMTTVEVNLGLVTNRLVRAFRSKATT